MRSRLLIAIVFSFFLGLASPMPASSHSAITFTASAVNQTVHAGSDPSLSFTVRNTSHRNVPYSLTYPLFVDIQLSVVDSNGNEVAANLPFMPYVVSGRTATLSPRECFTVTFPLSSWRYSLSPGTYTMKATWYSLSAAPFKLTVT